VNLKLACADSPEDRRARRTEKREVFARFLHAASRAQMAASRYRSHYDPDHPHGQLAEEQSAAVVGMNQAYSVLILASPHQARCPGDAAHPEVRRRYLRWQATRCAW